MVSYITETDVKRILTYPESLKLARETFRLIHQKKMFMPPKMYLTLPEEGDFRAMPAFFTKEKHNGGCGIKWISVFPKNIKKAIPTVNGTILLSSYQTGQLIAILEANTITAMRTAAAAALASKLMANPGPKVLAIVGAGAQAHYQLKAHLALYPSIREVRVWGYLPGEAERFCRGFSAIFSGMRASSGIQECVESAQIVITCTSSRKPLVKKDWLRPGVHINAIGADAKGKEELDPQILKNARVIVDEWQQASHSGEINVPLSRGMITRKNIAGDLSEVVSGKKKGRLKPSEVTVFDSTGLAALDIYFSQYVYEHYAAQNTP